MQPDLTAVQAALGLAACLLRDPSLWAELRIGAEHMPEARLAALFGAVQALDERGIEPEDAVLRAEIEKRGARFSEADFDALHESGVAENVAEYQRILLRDYRLRSLRQLRNRLHAAVESGDVDEAMAEVQRAANDTPVAPGGESLKAVLWQVFAEIEKPVPAVPTGLDPLDWWLDGGLRPGEVMVVAARPRVGKSAFALQALLHVAGSGIPVAVWSLEMSKKQWLRRALSSLSAIRMRALRTGAVRDHELPDLHRAAGALSGLPLHFADGYDTTPSGWRLEAARQVRQKRVGLLVIDYLQLMQPDRKVSSREQEVARLSREVKRAAIDFGVPVMLLAQLNREAENRVPSLANLRESGAVEQDADEVFFLHRTLDEDTQKLNEDGLGILAKNRDGESGAFPVRYDPSSYRFLAVESRLEAPPETLNGRRVYGERD